MGSTTGEVTTGGTTGSECVPSANNCFCTNQPIASATCNNSSWEILNDVSADSEEIDIQPGTTLHVHGDFVSLGNNSIKIAPDAELHVDGSMTLTDTDSIAITINSKSNFISNNSERYLLFGIICV
jgi:hypothetical protein